MHAGKKNALAVRVEKNATPGSVKEKTFDNPDKNGGALGADNPTYHASIGWDWIPTIRGRDTGIWNDVYLATTGPVTIDDPFVEQHSAGQARGCHHRGDSAESRVTAGHRNLARAFRRDSLRTNP